MVLSVQTARVSELVIKNVWLRVWVVRPNKGHNRGIKDSGAAATYLLDFFRRQSAGAHAAQDPFRFSIAQHLCSPFQGQPCSRLAREQIINRNQMKCTTRDKNIPVNFLFRETDQAAVL
jgi:hypothetical protein